MEPLLRERKVAFLKALPGQLTVSYFLTAPAGFSFHKHCCCRVESEPAVIDRLALMGLVGGGMACG